MLAFLFELKVKNLIPNIIYISAISFLLSVVFIIYLPAQTSPFIFDDFHNLAPLGDFGGVTDINTAKLFIFSNPSGPLGRPVSMATFLLDDNTWPSNSAYFKNTNVALHIICGLSIFLLMFRFIFQELRLNKEKALLFTAASVALWLIHPMQVSTVSYVVQRMTILSAIFTALSLYSYLFIRKYTFNKSKLKLAAAILIFILSFILGMLSKENAFGLLLLICFLELFYFEKSVVLKSGFRLKINHAITLSSICIAFLYLTYSYWGAGYSVRDFSLFDRIIYQIAAIGDYIAKTIFPVASRYNIFSGFFEIKGELTSAFYIFNFVLFTALSSAAALAILKRNAICIGFLFFISLHLIESTIIPLELYFEHRNYLPSFGLIAIITTALLSVTQIRKRVKAVLYFALLFYCATTTLLLTSTWGAPSQLYQKIKTDEPLSMRSQLLYAKYLEAIGLPDLAIEYVNKARVLAPNNLEAALEQHYYNCFYGFGENSTIFDDESLLFTLGGTRVLQAIIDLDDDNREACLYKVNDNNVISLFDVIEDSKTFGNHKTASIFYYNVKSNYYIARIDFERSIEAIDNALKLGETFDLLLMKSGLLISAGLYGDARDSLNLAIELDRDRRLFLPTRAKEAIDLIEFINKKEDEIINSNTGKK